MRKKAKIGCFVTLEIILCLSFANFLQAQGASGILMADSNRATVDISRTWQLPEILKEISGIAYIDAERIACVQDEVGTIFIYNILTNGIESEVPFGPPGDYEAIAVVNNDAYVAVADGRIIEISAYLSDNPGVKEYGTHLTVTQNVEGLCHDKKNKRLLVAIKDQEEGSPLYKGIYSFDLVTKTMPVKPVMKIDLQDPIFGKPSFKKPQALIQPSEIAINPSTGDFFISDAVRSQVLIMDQEGKIKALHALNKSEFIHPEGIMFTPSGELFIANEGSKELPAKLMRVSLR
jgi:uncharacterized protein YjiK